MRRVERHHGPTGKNNRRRRLGTAGHLGMKMAKASVAKHLETPCGHWPQLPVDPDKISRDTIRAFALLWGYNTSPDGDSERFQNLVECQGWGLAALEHVLWWCRLAIDQHTRPPSLDKAADQSLFVRRTSVKLLSVFCADTDRLFIGDLFSSQSLGASPILLHF